MVLQQGKRIKTAINQSATTIFLSVVNKVAKKRAI
jgi:hypothetical protein